MIQSIVRHFPLFPSPTLLPLSLPPLSLDPLVNHLNRCPVLSVTLMCCGQTVGWIKIPLGTEVGLGPGDVVLDGVPAPPTERGTAAPHFSVHVYCGQTVAHLTAELLLIHV